MVVRVGSVNWYAYNKRPYEDFDFLNGSLIDFIGFQEIWRHVRLARKKLTNYRVAVGNPLVKESKEVAVALHKDNKFLDAWGKEVSDARPGEETKVFKDRWVTVVKWKRNGIRYAGINYHGEAVIQNRKTGELFKNSRRVIEWIKAARRIQRTIRRLQDNGYKVFVTGDFNYRNFRRIEKFVLAYWSPQRIFERNGLHYMDHGLDYVAGPNTMRILNVERIDPKYHGGDHSWLIVDFEENGNP